RRGENLPGGPSRLCGRFAEALGFGHDVVKALQAFVSDRAPLAWRRAAARRIAQPIGRRHAVFVEVAARRRSGGIRRPRLLAPTARGFPFDLADRLLEREPLARDLGLG